MFSSVVFMSMADWRCSDDRWVYKNKADSCLVAKTVIQSCFRATLEMNIYL